MNEMQLKEFSDDKIIYLFAPEGEGEPGEIEYNFRKREARIIKPAGDSSPSYSHHAIIAVEKCVEKNNLPIKFTNAWH